MAGLSSNHRKWSICSFSLYLTQSLILCMTIKSHYNQQALCPGKCGQDCNLMLAPLEDLLSHVGVFENGVIDFTQKEAHSVQ